PGRHFCLAEQRLLDDLARRGRGGRRVFGQLRGEIFGEQDSHAALFGGSDDLTVAGDQRVLRRVLDAAEVAQQQVVGGLPATGEDDLQPGGREMGRAPARQTTVEIDGYAP